MAKYEWATKFEGQDGSKTSWKKGGSRLETALVEKTSFFTSLWHKSLDAMSAAARFRWFQLFFLSFYFNPIPSRFFFFSSSPPFYWHLFIRCPLCVELCSINTEKQETWDPSCYLSRIKWRFMCARDELDSARSADKIGLSKSRRNNVR